MAETALTLFPVRAGKLHFLNHAENTTFRVDAANGKRYLLRVHRDGYHTEPAIKEELSWLKHISQTTSLSVPSPILSHSGNFLEKVSAAGVPNARFCALFHWVEGKFIFKRVREKDVFELGKLIAQLHRTSEGRPVKHRRYWQAEGLLGKSPTFGSIQSLSGANAKDLKIIHRGRDEVFQYLKIFEKKFPDRQALIHADLHFGNFLSRPTGLGAIDFDDCGLGFKAYDLAIPLLGLAFMLKKAPRKKYLGFVDALQNGYASLGSWDQKDIEALPYFVAARRILMLGWLQSRSEIPELRKRLVKGSRSVAKFLADDEWRKFS